ncbi:MAG: OmpA family protein [Methylococcales bacterium]|nr:OmpA family protein [Methylococcales bacterium]
MYSFTRIIALFKKVITLLIFAILVTGCATKRNAQLEEARAVYDQVSGNPAVLTAPSAKLYLNKARASLEKAAIAETTKEINHIAYIGKKEALLAQELAERTKAEKELVKLDKEKTRVMLEKRSFEAARARADTDRALAEVRTRSLEAARAREETEKALADARAKSLEAERAIARAKKLEKELSELNAKKTERGLVFTLGDVLFGSGKATLLPSSARNLNKLVSFLQENQDRKVLVEGHTDSLGSNALNMRLSERRAYAVRVALLEKGVNSARISSRGYGEDNPVAENTTSMGRQQNRRVEIVVLNKN